MHYPYHQPGKFLNLKKINLAQFNAGELEFNVNFVATCLQSAKRRYLDFSHRKIFPKTMENYSH